MRPAPAVLASFLLAASLTACEQTDCTPTTTAARPAGKVDVGTPGRSAVVQATLRTARGPLSGRMLVFDVLDDDATVYRAEAVTGRDGTARADLKRADAEALLALVRAEEFRASFAGDGTYCASDDTATVQVVRR